MLNHSGPGYGFSCSTKGDLSSRSGLKSAIFIDCHLVDCLSWRQHVQNVHPMSVTNWQSSGPKSSMHVILIWMFSVFPSTSVHSVSFSSTSALQSWGVWARRAWPWLLHPIYPTSFPSWCPLLPSCTSWDHLYIFTLFSSASSAERATRRTNEIFLSENRTEPVTEIHQNH